MRIFKRITLAILILGLAASSFYFLYLRPRYVVPILMYHSITNDTNSTLNVSPENFARQMAFITKNDFTVISLDSLVEGLKKGTKFSHKTIVITFDDGYENNYLYAFPFLANYNAPATMFLITSFIGTQDGYMNWDEVRLMAKNGIDFGGHTRNDVYLPSLSETHRLWEEVKGCKDDIENNAGMPVKYFCYPTGGFTEKVKEAVRMAGYNGACTTNRGHDRLNRDVYELNRIKVTNSDMNKPLHFRAKLSGYYNLFRSKKKSD